MALVIPPNTSRDTSDPNLFSDVYDNDAAIIDEVNGNLDNANIAPAASIALSKLAQGSSGAVTLSSGVTSLSHSYVNSTGSTSLGTSDTDITGAAVTVAAGTYLIVTTFDMLVTPDADGETIAVGELHIGGVQQGFDAVLGVGGSADAGVVALNTRATVGQTYTVSISPSKEVKLMGHREDVAGTGAASAQTACVHLVKLA